MLKLVIHVHCDECNEQFQFARASAYTSEALSFNTSALTAMLSHYFWQTSETRNNKFHYCPECFSNFYEMEEELAPVPQRPMTKG